MQLIQYLFISYNIALSIACQVWARGTKTQSENEYKLNNGVFSLISLRLMNFNVPRIKKAITKNDSIVLVSWCLCGKIPVDTINFDK